MTLRCEASGVPPPTIQVGLQKNKITQNRKSTRKCSYLNVASGTSLWARYQEASLDVEELVLQLLSSPGCQQDHCLNLSLSICPHHLHHQLVGLQLVTTCAPPAMVWGPSNMPPSPSQSSVSAYLWNNTE